MHYSQYRTQSFRGANEPETTGFFLILSVKMQLISVYVDHNWLESIQILIKCWTLALLKNFMGARKQKYKLINRKKNLKKNKIYTVTVKFHTSFEGLKL